ncbi:Uncharacterized protein TCM_039931 [Theobroma cacao]|uniref:YTH domain-containing family protein n=1 Tax=Theobroma cacao TaxID=3641 RepID=A0A061GYN3_THECC|nr:Uncharacterized protein TCM_039931 [Theobroma cacao]
MDAADYPGASNESGDFSIIRPLSACGSHQQHVSYGEQLCVRLCASNFLLASGYGNSTGSWDGYPHFVNADGLHLSPVICNENQSLLLHASYGFTPEMSYGQYSPVGTPLPSLLVEGPLCASQQVPFPPIYRPLPASPNVPAAVPVIPTELMTLESSRENVHYGTRSGYLIQYGSYGVGNISGIFGSSAVTSPAAYSQPVGILGSYEHRQMVASYTRILLGWRSGSSVGHYPHDGSYQSSKFSSASVPFLGLMTRQDLFLTRARDERETRTQYVFLMSLRVKASGQFCGVAQMAGPVDFESDADFWQQDRWSGQFPVQWHVIKDVPNNGFRHILLQNNDNKPVTHSRDSQEVA